MLRDNKYPKIRTPSVEVQVQCLWRSADLHWAEVHGVILLIFCLYFALLAIIFYFSEHLGRWLVFLLQELLDRFHCFVDFLVRSLGRGLEVVFCILAELTRWEEQKIVKERKRE